MIKILITGSTGFVGQHVVRFLSNKKEVEIYSLDRQLNESPYISKGFIWDNVNEIKNEHIDIIIHLAGLAHDLKNANDESAYFEVNYGLTKKLFNLFNENDSLKKFICVSSVKAVADRVTGVLTEEDSPSPMTAYGKSKLKAEEYIKSNHKGKKFYILRPCMIYGSNNKGNLGLLYSMISRGVPYPFGNFDNKRSYLSINNLVFVFWYIIERQLPNGTYNVSDKQPISTLQLIKLVEKSVGRKIRILSVPKGIIRLIGKIGDRIPIGLNTEKLNKIVGDYVVDSSKLLSQMNIDLPTDTENGVLDTFDSIKKNE